MRQETPRGKGSQDCHRRLPPFRQGVDCRPEQILIGAGSEYLLMLLSQILGNGRKIAMENPTYKQAYRVLKGEGYPVIPVDMDRHGMDVQRLSRSSADVAYVMPSHQYPTGIVMPVKRRQELLAWAYSGADRYLIEDDYDSEFRYKGKPIPALQGMDRGGRVIYMGTFFQVHSPGYPCGIHGAAGAFAGGIPGKSRFLSFYGVQD